MAINSWTNNILFRNMYYLTIVLLSMNLACNFGNAHECSFNKKKTFRDFFWVINRKFFFKFPFISMKRIQSKKKCVANSCESTGIITKNTICPQSIIFF